LRTEPPLNGAVFEAHKFAIGSKLVIEPTKKLSGEMDEAAKAIGQSHVAYAT
jgi:hypothetical protein